MFQGCSGVVPGCSGGVPGMFRGVPEVFRGVPGVFRGLQTPANLRCCMNRPWKLTLLRSLINSERNNI